MIVVFGSVAVDLVTEVARIPVAGETVLCAGYTVVPGSKGGNQAVAAARAGSKTALVATCGRDAFASLATPILRESGVDLTHLRSIDDPTGVCFITVDERAENAIVAAAGANLRTELGQLAACSLQRGDILLLQREISDKETFAAVAYAKGKGARVILNAAPGGAVPADVLRELDVLVVNENETLVVGRALGMLSDDLEEIAENIHRDHGCSVIVTLGPKGAFAWHRTTRWAIPAPVVEAVDTTAAGDSFVGAFASTLDRDQPFEVALRRGVMAGSLCCTRRGAQPSIPDAAEVDRMLARYAGHDGGVDHGRSRTR